MISFSKSPGPIYRLPLYGVPIYLRTVQTHFSRIHHENKLSINKEGGMDGWGVPKQETQVLTRKWLLYIHNIDPGTETLLSSWFSTLFFISLKAEHKLLFVF